MEKLLERSLRRVIRESIRKRKRIARAKIMSFARRVMFVHTVHCELSLLRIKMLLIKYFQRV